MENVISQVIESLKGVVSSEVIIFLISMCPVLELRGGIIAGTILNVEWVRTYIICVIGNLLPIPFVVLFIRKIFDWLKNTRFVKFVRKIEEKAEKKSASVQKYKFWGLTLFVAIPLPGTGAWTGALIAAMLDMKLKDCMLPIIIGVLIAGLVVTLACYGVVSLAGLF